VEHTNRAMIRGGEFILRDAVPAQREIVGMITTNSVDRYGEIVEPDGAALESYRKNPVVLLNHKNWGLPVGKNLWIKTEGNGLLAKTRFADTSEGIDTFRLYDQGFMKAWSIGFLPLTWEDGTAAAGYRRKFTRWELLEYSAVTVPANPEAVSRALDCIESPRIREELEKLSRCKSQPLEEVLQRLEEQSNAIAALRNSLTALEFERECERRLRVE
jgi:HK97 family phage prohead protease